MQYVARVKGLGLLIAQRLHGTGQVAAVRAGILFLTVSRILAGNGKPQGGTWAQPYYKNTEGPRFQEGTPRQLAGSTDHSPDLETGAR